MPCKDYKNFHICGILYYFCVNFSQNLIFRILFNFHKNEPTHKKAKVAPPRLNGVKIGVFASRSPHRPNPIGLSLVKIDKIEGNDIYFFGVDIVDETPVLDIKPYIPQYDNPFTTFTTKQEEETNLNNLDMLNTSE